MRTFKQSLNQCLAALVLLANPTLESVQAVASGSASLVDPTAGLPARGGALVAERVEAPGALEGGEAAVAIAPSNSVEAGEMEKGTRYGATGRYGLDPAERKRLFQRYGLEGVGPEESVATEVGEADPGLSESPVVSGIGERRGEVEKKLSAIVLDEVEFDGLPLPEVIRYLRDASIQRDPAGNGVNFVINPNVRSPRQTGGGAGGGMIDPTTGQMIPWPQPEPLDMNSVLVRITPELRDVRLIDVIEAIVRVADKPIDYIIEDYGVVFSAGSESAGDASGQVAASVGPLEVRTFKLNADAFAAGLEHALGRRLDLPPAGDPARSRMVQSGLRQLCAALGIEMGTPGKSIFYNDLTGALLMRATAEDLEAMTAAVAALAPAIDPDVQRMMQERYGLAPGR